jgi:GNAT superfamily N-acetyltransferase
MKTEYRKATIADAALIASLAERIWKKHYITIITMEQIEYMLDKMYSAKSLEEQMNAGQYFTLVYLDGEAIGYIAISKKEEGHYFLNKFYVEVGEQGKGIGTQLFNYILFELKDARKISLTVNRQNFKAINFYFKNGFTISEVADFDIGDGYFMNDFVMVKNIK